MKTKFTWKEAEKINWLDDHKEKELTLTPEELTWLFGQSQTRVAMMKRYLIPNSELNVRVMAPGVRSRTNWARCTVNVKALEHDRNALLAELEDSVLTTFEKLKGRAIQTQRKLKAMGFDATPDEMEKIGIIHPAQRQLLEGKKPALLLTRRRLSEKD